VVNEPIFAPHREPGLLRRAPFYRAMGAEYIALSLRWAAEADPAAKLVINEYDLEHDTAEHETRRVAMLELLTTLVKQGAPLHALGMQAHLRGGLAFDAARLHRFIDDVASLGLEVHITELDVIDRQLFANIAARDRAVAGQIRDFLDVVLAHPAVTQISTWGLDDRHSWMNDNSYTRRSDNLPARGHPYDAQLQRKPAWEAMAQELRSVPIPPKWTPPTARGAR